MLTFVRTLLFAPFVPFIVLFCHVMETKDHADFARLEAFVSSIRTAQEISEPAAKMEHLFQVLYRIAARYIEIGMQYPDGGTSSAPTDMDAQLAALGFPRAGIYQASSTQPGMNAPLHDQPALEPMLWMGHHMQLEDWLYTNQASMELLQGDDGNSLWTE